MCVRVCARKRSVIKVELKAIKCSRCVRCATLFARHYHGFNLDSVEIETNRQTDLLTDKYAG